MPRLLVGALVLCLESVARCAAVSIVLLAVLMSIAPQVAAQEKTTVVAGNEVLLKESKDVISEVKGSPGDPSLTVTGKDDAKLYVLTYKAPVPAPAKTVEVTYKIGTTSKQIKVEVTVTEPPLTDARTVLPGSETTLMESADPIEVYSQPSVGSAVVRPAPDKKFALVYRAPPNVDYQTALVYYRVGKQPARYEVVVSSNPWGNGYEAAFKVLFSAFVLAALIEWALSVVFNWRWFLMVFDAKGIKTIATLIVSAVIVVSFKLDIARELINILRNSSYPSSFATWLLSALVVAGGSAGVNSLMVTLGLRSVRTVASLQDRPPPKKAWLAVQAFKSTAGVESVDVRIKRDGETHFNLLAKLYGLRAWGSFRWPFFRDRSRFPNYGGFYLEPGVAFTLELEGRNKKDELLQATKVTRGPYIPAEGAIIDVEVSF